MLTSRGPFPAQESEMAPHLVEAVDAICVDILARPLETSPSLSGDFGGRFLLFDAMASWDGRNQRTDWEAQIRELIEHVLKLGPVMSVESLHGGYAGLGWLIQHARRRGFDDPDLGELDEALLELLSAPSLGRFDVIGGLAGVGIYGLERRAEAPELLGLVVDRIDEVGVRFQDGIAWWTHPGIVSPLQTEMYPVGKLDLGMAHGTAGVIALLAAAAREGVRTDIAQDLLERSVPWLLARFEFITGGWRLPSVDGARCTGPRLAWCYNELGAACSIALAGSVLRRAEWSDFARRVAVACAAVEVGQGGARDGCLCHGGAGISRAFRYLARQFGDSTELERAAQAWAEWTVGLRRPGAGIGGFSYAMVRPDQSIRCEPRTGFLEGAAGIALAFLAELGACAAPWERLLGLL